MRVLIWLDPSPSRDEQPALGDAGSSSRRRFCCEGFVRVIGTDYFRTMGVPMRAGRDFADTDTPDSPLVMIINESMAHTLWPGRSAIGRRIGQGNDFTTVIGVVGDVRHGALESPFTGEVYYSMHQGLHGAARIDLIVRTALQPAQLATAARSALAPVAGDAAKNTWTPLQDAIDQVASPRRFVVVLLGGFASFALLLAALGIYALISYGVT